MTLQEAIFSLIQNTKEKMLLEVGSHDDILTQELAENFKKVYSYYEYLKIPERAEENIEIKKLSYSSVLSELSKFDVILLVNEFHHFPDVLQMQTYELLESGQELLLVEWDYTGNTNNLYACFQNCEPLSTLTREILRKFIEKGYIQLTDVKKMRYDTYIESIEELIEYFKFMLPDHWRFGEKEFMEKAKNISFPTNIWEGADVFKIKKAEDK